MILCALVTVSRRGRVCFYADDTVVFTYAKKSNSKTLNMPLDASVHI